MKTVKRILSLSLVLCLIFNICIFASATNDTKVDPIILVHGMTGWGENDAGKHDYPYWGYSNDNDVLKMLRNKGYVAYAPTVGPFSSAWDRACELFAQLCGTVVDYGEAHSKRCGHRRYGRDYTGRGFLEKDWYENGRINIVSHSFGGPASIVFISLLTNGSEEEKKSADCSPLFEGGHSNAVYSLTTLESPSNGSPIANVMNDTYIMLWLISFVMNVSGMSSNPKLDFMVDQFGLTVDPATGNKAKFNPIGIAKLANSKDHCAYDMSLQNARKICETYGPSASTYYFSVTANQMEKNEIGMVVPTAENAMLKIAGAAIGAMAGLKIKGIKTDKEWAYNDGMVPVPSALYPYGHPHEDYSGTDVTDIKTGVWYVTPVNQGGHGYGIAGKSVEAFWPEYLERMENLANK